MGFLDPKFIDPEMSIGDSMAISGVDFAIPHEPGARVGGRNQSAKKVRRVKKKVKRNKGGANASEYAATMNAGALQEMAMGAAGVDVSQSQQLDANLDLSQPQAARRKHTTPNKNGPPKLEGVTSQVIAQAPLT